MNTSDVMTQEVVSILPTAPIADAVYLMTSNAISGLPVIDKDGRLVGMVTEGDFLRRSELGTEKRRARWIDFLSGADAMAARYIQTHSRRVSEVVTKPAIAVQEDTPLEEVVRIMEKRRIKRLPVVRGERVVGIISRANLLQALAAINSNAPSNLSDEAVRAAILKEINLHLESIGRCDIVVHDGVVDLWGTVYANRDAIRVAAENIPGVKAVRDHLVWIDPFSGMLIESADHVTEPVPTGARATQQSSR